MVRLSFFQSCQMPLMVWKKLRSGFNIISPEISSRKLRHSGISRLSVQQQPFICKNLEQLFDSVHVACGLSLGV